MVYIILSILQNKRLVDDRVRLEAQLEVRSEEVAAAKDQAGALNYFHVILDGQTGRQNPTHFGICLQSRH